ncbi:phenazine biosynthesis protein PhzF [Acinetobacter sp. TGL-Y2]|uniref:PhzF family phenazine biosynthesis protein n=1 Tax=Acinetobacter sp. TGL-Y2 TaxID=1407071 RepID=UPI0007A6656B|nr:PhzF family phenazine biosynthesis protein [Acinetobacter sp. TGL-Y2]AMW78577.1 phenazine biosynthesis protein PhzF [Acinetobacter sp. TGL-Y2]
MKMYQVDAFSNHLFSGNPAAVIILDEWLDDQLMLNIAQENNLSETSFAKKVDQLHYEIKWFSPVKEVQFCGYGTLATSFIIFRNHPDLTEITFHVAGLGDFYIQKLQDGFISMNLPVQIPARLVEIPELLKEALTQECFDVFINPQAYIVIYPTVESVLNERPNFEKIKQLGGRRVAITAKNDVTNGAASMQSINLAMGLASPYDIVSRYFTPSMGIDEDPVTGSLHTSLIPLWYPQLKKDKITAYQASKRGGVLHCKLLEHDRVEISGQCKLYMQAEIFI